ncbi:MAG: PH domain-containing protein [Hyphomonadaceae bacterium]
MVQYVDRSLANGEQVLLRGQWPATYWALAWAALIGLGWLVIGLFIFAGAALHMMTTEFAVTNRRIILKRGWITLDTQEFSPANVEEVRVSQSLLGKIFGFGRVIATGTGEGVITFPPMSRPIEFRRAIQNAREDARQNSDGEAHAAAGDGVEAKSARKPAKKPRADDRRNDAFDALMGPKDSKSAPAQPLWPWDKK